MIALLVSKPQPTRGDYLLIGDDALWLLCWLTCELARGRGWRRYRQTKMEAA